MHQGRLIRERGLNVFSVTRGGALYAASECQPQHTQRHKVCFDCGTSQQI